MRLERVDVRTIEIIKREFKKIDADGDGFLTVDEITNSTSPILPVVEHLEEEGEVEEEEEGVAEDEIKREFEKLDADGDGFLSIEEIRNSTSPVFPVAVQEENDVAGGEEDSTAGTRYR
jgi:Ca2+-binding EF-hand superfamily protein